MRYVILVLALCAACTKTQIRLVDRNVCPDEEAMRRQQEMFERRAYKVLRAGNIRYDLGDYKAAITLYQESYRYKPLPETLFNIAQAYRQLGDRQKAVWYYRAFLRAKPDAKNKAEVEQLIDDLEAELEKGTVCVSADGAGTLEAVEPPRTQPAAPPVKP